MGTAALAQKVILQAIEDLLNKNGQDWCVEFLWGEGFDAWAEAAGISAKEQEEILRLVEPALYRTWSKRARPIGEVIREREAALV